MMQNPLEDIHTPTTPSDAFQVSGSEDEIMKFDCNVVLTSGRTLGPFKCDELISVGWIRNKVRKELEDLRNKGELNIVDFHLTRDGGENIISNDHIKIYELVDINDAVLSITNATGEIERASNVQRPKS